MAVEDAHFCSSVVAGESTRVSNALPVQTEMLLTVLVVETLSLKLPTVLLMTPVTTATNVRTASEQLLAQLQQQLWPIAILTLQTEFALNATQTTI